MANPLAKNGNGIPVPMQGNVQKMQNASNMFNGNNANPQQMLQNYIHNNPQVEQNIQALRQKYGMNKSAVEIAQAVCKEQGINYNQMAQMIMGKRR